MNDIIHCGCRCIKCKSPDLLSNRFMAEDKYEDIHHTCRICNTHFNHMDGEIYNGCIICKFK